MRAIKPPAIAMFTKIQSPMRLPISNSSRPTHGFMASTCMAIRSHSLSRAEQLVKLLSEMTLHGLRKFLAMSSMKIIFCILPISKNGLRKIGNQRQFSNGTRVQANEAAKFTSRRFFFLISNYLNIRQGNNKFCTPCDELGFSLHKAVHETVR